MDKLDLILEKISSMDEKISTMDEKINTMDEKINIMDEKINLVDEKVEEIKFTIENEIRPNIMCIAEGHLDLSRKLNEVIKSSNEFELLTVKVNMLEIDVRELKRKSS